MMLKFPTDSKRIASSDVALTFGEMRMFFKCIRPLIL